MSVRIVQGVLNIIYENFMLSLTEYIRRETLEELENQFFECICDWPDGLLDVESLEFNEPIYDDYKKLIYQDIIQETLTKTYDFSKFKEYLNNKFKDKIQYNINIVEHPRYKYLEKNNNRLFIQVDKSVTDKDIEAACNLFGYKIAGVKKDKNSKAFTIEPIYFDEVASKVNKMKYLYHVVPIDNKRKFEFIKESFKKKFGLKPSKREKKSKHFKRTYVFTENVKKNQILSLADQNNSLNDFCLIRISLQEYLTKFDDRQIEWFTDPNMDNAVWTREIIPYKYLEFFEIKNKEFPKELGF